MEERDGVRRRVVGKRKRREWNTGKQGRTEEGKNGGRTGERIGERRIRTMPIFKSDLPIGIRKAAISLHSRPFQYNSDQSAPSTTMAIIYNLTQHIILLYAYQLSALTHHIGRQVAAR